MKNRNLLGRSSRNRLWSALLLFTVVACSPEQAGFYVATDGNDDQPGTAEAPFRTVEKAQLAVRAFKQKNGLPRNGITVYLRGGVYPLRQTLHFTGEDSGKEGAPVVYRACPDEHVSFIGGEEVKQFTPLNDPEAQSRIKKEFHGRIVQASLKDQGIAGYGELTASGFGRATQPSGMELFFNGEPMTLARYPNNNEWMHIASVPQAGDSLFGGDERTGKGVHYGRFAYGEDRPSAWLENDDVWLQGYWTWDWADSYVKVDRIDAAKKEFVLKPPHGVYGYTSGQRYYALNILEELDSPGEWYVDRKKGVLYFWPPAQVNPGSTFVSLMTDWMLHLDHAEHVRIEGFTFEYTRGSAIRVEEGSHNTIGGCTVRNIGNNAVAISGGHHNGVSGCDLYNLGDGGIHMQGGDRLTLAPGHHFAVNNHIHHFSRINRTYRPAVMLHGVGNVMSHNYIHDAPHMAVAFDGNDHLLEYNRVHDIAQETGDVGAFYIGRDWSMRGNVIRYNYFHHQTGPELYGVNAIYLDDFASGTTIFGNVFHRIGIAAFVGGGHDNRVENNVFVDCGSSIHVDARGVNWAKYYMDRKTYPEMYDKLDAVNYTQPPYSVRYPELVKILDGDPAQPKGNVFRSNLSYGGKWRDVGEDVDEITIEDNYVLREIPSGIDVARGKFYPENETVLEEIRFQRIPFDSIGLYKDKYRNGGN
ncbi:MAG: right-handed parallel beta-helix repeat-containing protein [Tannerella sp.]|jgi:hypothetical protein|nr:right-handed parallel beta-helix repeat-containing protein [Tannerella sp.]